MSSGKVAFTVRLPEDLHRRLKVWCAQSGSDLQEVMSEAVRRFLDPAAAASSSWPLPDATPEESRYAARVVEVWRGASEDLRAYLRTATEAAAKRHK